MATLMVQPSPFTVIAETSLTTAPARNLNLDFPGMVWRSDDLAPYIIVKVPSGWNTVAVVGSNMLVDDFVRVRAADTEAGTSNAPTLDQTFHAWEGLAPEYGAISLLKLSTLRTEQYVRIDFASPLNPAGYVQAQRLVVGKRFENDGLDIGADRFYQDTSSVEEGLGYTAVDRYNVRVGWKLTISGVKTEPFETQWHPFARWAGNSRAFLFVEDDDPAYLQNRAALVRFTGQAKGSSAASDYNLVDATVLSVT